jgi:arylsulfatase A-like enzyme
MSMFRCRICSLVLIMSGAFLGYVAAQSDFSVFRPAAAASPLSGPALQEKQGECCSEGANKALLLARADLNVTSVSARTASSGKKPNILVIWGDDIGIHNISAYNHGIMGYRTPNIDRLAKEGAMFTDFYAQQSCTAGRASFILGQHPFRTGLLTIGMPGSPHGIPDWTPTIADLLKPQGYATGQFGKNHLGDNNKHLPTVHGFDEFFGNLYHLNAEEEPEGYYYPKDPEFKKKYGPRGVLHCFATDVDDTTVDPKWGKVGKQKIEDTGPLNSERMPTIDKEIYGHATDFIDRAVKQGKPFFVWFNATRMHVWTHLKKESTGRTGIGLYPDGMVEHDEMVGDLLKKIDDSKLADNTIVIYGTDNGAEVVSWPDGGTTPFHGEKGTTWEGGLRVPCMLRWPGVIKPGTIINDIMSQEDWMPTFLAAAGEPEIVEKLKQGYEAGGKTFKIHADGYNFMPFFKGDVKKSPRDTIYYFGQGGELNAVRWNDWKVHFAVQTGNIATGVRSVPGWPAIVHLRADPYERAVLDSQMYMRWYADQMWLFVPVQQKIKDFLGTIPGFPFQEGSSLSASGINYQTLKAAGAMKRLQELESISSPR